MRPSSFVTLFVLVTTIFAAPVNLTSFIDGESGISTSSEDRPMPLRRRDQSQTCVCCAVNENLGEKIEGFDWMYRLKKDFGGSPAIIRRIIACKPEQFRTLFHEIINQRATGHLIKVAIERNVAKPASSFPSDSSDSSAKRTCEHYYMVTKDLGVHAKALGIQISEAELESLRDKAREESKEKFKLVYSGDEEKNFVYRRVNGKLEANMIGDWAFALPVGHADPGKPEVFVDE